MTSAPSLQMLQKAKVDQAPPAEIETAVDEEVTVDVDTLSAKELDALVVQYEIDTPENWKKMKVAEKRSWLKEQFEEDGEDADGEEAAEATEPDQADAPVEVGGEPEPAPAPAVTETKAVAKPKGKGKKTLQGEIEQPGDDVLSDLVHSIENMNEHEARHLVTALTNETDMSQFKLGGVLSLIQANGWYAPYGSFREYVEKDLGMHYRKATYWAAIYNSLAESKVPWDKVKHIGWTKLKEIAEVLTLENMDEWVSIATNQTTLQLIETVKASKQKDAPKALEDQASKTVTTITFKVHEDQKEVVKSAIAKAKDESGTAVDTAALEFICIDYLGGQSVTDRLKKMGLEAALDALDKAFPEATIEVTMPDAE